MRFRFNPIHSNVYLEKNKTYRIDGRSDEGKYPLKVGSEYWIHPKISMEILYSRSK
jgi:hypothetical protein